MRISSFALSLFAVAALAPAAAFAQSPGAAAPAFTLTDTAGRNVQLADYRGKYIVLEWTNPECPFVRKHYTSGNMQGLQKEWGAREVVWLSINSTNTNNSEFKTPAEMAQWMRSQGAAQNATLIDSTSATGMPMIVPTSTRERDSRSSIRTSSRPLAPTAKRMPSS